MSLMIRFANLQDLKINSTYFYICFILNQQQDDKVFIKGNSESKEFYNFNT